LIGYTDSDFASSIDDRKRKSRYVFIFGSGVVAWASKKKSIVTLSSVKAESVATTTVACQTVWMRRIVTEFLHEQEEPTHIFCDDK